MSILNGLARRDWDGFPSDDGAVVEWDDVRGALTSPPPSVLDDMMDEYDEHTSLVNETGHGYFCVARDCGYRSDTADLARRHAMQKALAAAAGGDDE